MDYSDNEENNSPVNEQEKKKRKRGVRNEECYKQNVTKKARLKGQVYTTKKGKQVSASTVGSDCK